MYLRISIFFDNILTIIKALWICLSIGLFAYYYNNIFIFDFSCHFLILHIISVIFISEKQFFAYKNTIISLLLPIKISFMRKRYRHVAVLVLKNDDMYCIVKKENDDKSLVANAQSRSPISVP